MLFPMISHWLPLQKFAFAKQSTLEAIKPLHPLLLAILVSDFIDLLALRAIFYVEPMRSS